MKFYINLVEEELSNIFNKIFKKLINKDKLKNLLKKETKISNINSILIEFTNKLENQINIDNLQKILKKKINYIKIIQIIKKYIIYYLLLFCSYLIKNEETYKDTIIKLQKINIKDKLLINHDDSINILNINDFLNNFIYILKIYKNDRERFDKDILINDKYKLLLIFINNEVTNDNINILVGDNLDKYHNNIFFILIKYLYLKKDVKLVYNILEEDDNITYTYIDIIIPIVNYIDQNLIENILNINEKKNNIINDLFNLLKKQQKLISEEEKINIIFKKNIIVPIIDDFLRYHKDTEIYDKSNDSKYDKSNTKIKYIISKINEIQNYYLKNEKERKKIDLFFYKRLSNRKAILYNELEEINIIRKLFLKGKKAIENNEYISNLLDIRKYAYINFNSLEAGGFTYSFNTTIQAIRYSNIEFMNPKIYRQAYNEVVETRVASKNEKVNIVGFILSNNNVNKIILKDLEDIKNENENDNINKIIYNSIKKKNKTDYYWLFNKNDHKYIKIKQDDFTYDNNDNCSLCKYIVLYIYNIYSEHVYDTIIKKIDDIKNSTLYNLYNIVYLEQQRTININNLLYKNNIEKIIYEKIKDIKDIKDTDENIIKGLEGKIIKLPNIKIDKDEKHKIIFKSKINIKESDNIFEEHNYICQHNIDFKEINYIKRKDINLYSERLFIFIKKYAFIHNNTYICKSCNELLDIKRYIVNIHNLSGEEGINININSNINLKDNLKYKNLGKLIEFIDKLVDKIALISNLTMFIGNNKETKFNRNKIIKKVIDLIIENYTLYIKLDKKDKEKKILDSQSYYGISLNYSKFFIFKLTEELFKFKSKDEDKYKKRKINNIILYIIFIILLELNKNHIINLSSDKLCNIILFNKYSKSIFENLNIRIDNSNSIKSLIKFPILCYYLYYFSCMIIKFKLWQFDDDNNKFDFIKVKIIIHSFVDMINHICENNILSKNNYIYDEIISLFYFKQKNIYDDILILKSIEEKQTNTINYNKIKNVITIIKNILPGIKLDGKLNLTYSTRKYIYICSNLIYRLKLKKEVDNTTYITKNENEEIYGIFKNNTFDKIVKYYDINNKSRSILLNDNQLKKIEKNIYNKIINDYEKVMIDNITKFYEINSRNIINYKNKVNQFNTNINTNTNINIKNNIESLDNFIKNLKNLYNN